MYQKYFKYFLIFTGIFVSVQVSFGQLSKREKLNDYLNEIKYSLDYNQYKRALEPMYKAFELDTVLPDELSYMHGLAMFHFEKYKSARKSLIRYVELTGDEGEYFPEAEEFIHMAEDKLGIPHTTCSVGKALGPMDEIVECPTCLGNPGEEHTCSHCEGHAKEVCDLCHGSGVLVKEGSFGSSYATCHRCNGTGVVTCKVCEGSGLESDKCGRCKGVGTLKKQRACPIKPLE